MQTKASDSLYIKRAEEVKQICSPIKRHLDITYFNYVRVNKDNTRVLLTDRPEWIESFYENKLYNERSVIDIEALKFGGYFTWDQFQDEKPFQVAKEDYNIANGITILNSFEDYTELYYFATTKNKINGCEIFKSEIDLFHRFILFFKDRGRSLLKEAIDSPILLDDYQNSFSHFSHRDIDKDIQTIQKAKVNRFSYVSRKKEKFFSQQETICASYYILQFSAREIAKKMNLSPRTVEEYINNIKGKLACTSKQTLIDKLLQLNIVDIENIDSRRKSFYEWKKQQQPYFLSFLAETRANRIYISEISDYFYLTKIEATILFYLCHGYCAKRISANMGCLQHTVETYIYTLRKKFGIRKKSELVALSIKYRILEKIIISMPNLIK